MIGKIMTGKSFRGCLQYCLNDKTAGEKKNESVMKNRAEVILYNQCFGNDKELIEQFNEVRWLNPKLSKPVLHVTLSLGKGESLPANKFAEMAQDCAHDLGFSNNQYVAVLHKDTEHQHIHIIANRVGYDGKTVSDSNTYHKIATLCRKLEIKHELRKVLSPNAFLPMELRNSHRLDQRKQQLKADITQSLARSRNYEQFVQTMTCLKYEVIKMRGIAFLDQQKVYTKGSEVGYSLTTIERALAQNQELNIENRKEITQPTFRLEKGQEESSQGTANKELKKESQPILHILLESNAPYVEGVHPSLMPEQRKRRRKLKCRHL